MLGVHRSVLSNWKARNSIPYEHILMLCDKYDISLDFILLGKKVPTSLSINSIKGRLFDKTRNSEKHFQQEILLLHTILSSSKNEIDTVKTKQDFVVYVQQFNIGMLNSIIISQKAKDNLSVFILELSIDEFDYILNNKHDFISLIFDFRNFFNKLATFDKVN